MSITRCVVSIFAAGLMVMGARTVSSQDYPSKPVRMVTAAAGGGSDFVARIVAQGISGPLGQQVIVDNRSTMLAAETASKAPSDGYTLLVAGISLWITPLLQTTSYDLTRDFSPIVMIARAPVILVVHPSVAANSVKELIGLARAKPGDLNYASGPTGGGSHLAAELFKHLAGVNIQRIAYKGGAPALVDVMGGRVQTMFDDISLLMPHVKTGKLRALAVASAEPTSLAPGLPTVAASGVPGYASDSIQNLWAPGKTPQSIVRRLNQEVVRLVDQPEVKEKLFNNGIEPVGGSVEQFGAKVQSEIVRMGKLIKDTGMKAD